MLPPPENYFAPLFPVVEYETSSQPLKTVAIISLNGSAHLDVCVTGGNRLAQEYGYKVVYQTILTYNGSAENVPLVHRELQAAIDDLTEIQPDVVLFCDRFECDTVLSMMEAAGYAPGVLGMFECGDTLESVIADVGVKVRYAVLPVEWDRRLQGESYQEPQWSVSRPYCTMCAPSATIAHSAAMYAAKYNSYSAAAKNPLNALTAAFSINFCVIEYAIFTCNCTDAAGILAAARHINIPSSFWGVLFADEYGNNVENPTVLLQVKKVCLIVFAVIGICACVLVFVVVLMS